MLKFGPLSLLSDMVSGVYSDVISYSTLSLTVCTTLKICFVDTFISKGLYSFTTIAVPFAVSSVSIFTPIIVLSESKLRLNSLKNDPESNSFFISAT
jgi:hypothetical protein